MALFLCHAACAILIGIGSLVTNLVSGLFIFGADIEWMAGAPSAMAYDGLDSDGTVSAGSEELDKPLEWADDEEDVEWALD